MKRFLILFCLIPAQLIYAQSNVDSLLRLLPDMKEDSLKVEAYIQLQGALYRKDLNQALNYATQAVSLAQKLDMPRKEAEARWHNSYILTDLKRYSEAQDECQEALAYFLEFGDSSWVADVKLQLVLHYYKAIRKKRSPDFWKF